MDLQGGGCQETPPPKPIIAVKAMVESEDIAPAECSPADFIGLASNSMREEIRNFSAEISAGPPTPEQAAVAERPAKRVKHAGPDFNIAHAAKAAPVKAGAAVKRAREVETPHSPLPARYAEDLVEDEQWPYDDDAVVKVKANKSKKEKTSKRSKKDKSSKKKKSKKHRKRDSSTSSSSSASSSSSSSGAQSVFREAGDGPGEKTQAGLMEWARKHPGWLAQDTIWTMQNKVGREGEQSKKGKSLPAVAKTFFLHNLNYDIKNMRNKREAYTICTVVDHLVLGRYVLTLVPAIKLKICRLPV